MGRKELPQGVQLSRLQCVQLCLKLKEADSDVTGVTYETKEPGRCVCHAAMTSVDPANATTWKTCKLVRKEPVILSWDKTLKGRSIEIPKTELCGWGCETTVDRSLAGQADAIMFYMKTTDIKQELPNPETRRGDQLYLWWCHESANTARRLWNKDLEGFQNYFNGTMHFRRDSDVVGIFMPHAARDWYLHRIGRPEEMVNKELAQVTSEEEFKVLFQELMKAKTADVTASWVVSDCNIVKGARLRMEFAKQMQEKGNFTLDIYGPCGNKGRIPRKNHDLYDVIRTYKFYFAFENTEHCLDYITEKLWYNSLYAGAVPVIWGTDRASYEKMAPPGSFIHAQDFDNDPVRLAAYLNKLKDDEEAYMEYFKWWMMPGFYPLYKLREPQIEGDIPTNNMYEYDAGALCNLCRILHEGKYRETPKVIPDLRENFYGKEKDECLNY